jgi:hypothetical protein
MRSVPVIALVVVGLFSIVARNFVGKFLYAVVHELPAVEVQEREFRKVMSVFSVGFGALLICMAILMATNVIFPW